MTTTTKFWRCEQAEGKAQSRISIRTNIRIQKQRGVSWTVGVRAEQRRKLTNFSCRYNKIMVWIQEFLRAEPPSVSVEMTNKTRCATPKSSIKHRTCKRSVCSCRVLQRMKSSRLQIKQKVLLYAKPPDLRKSIAFWKVLVRDITWRCGIILTGENGSAQRKTCRFGHQRPHTEWPRIEPGPPVWEASV